MVFRFRIYVKIWYENFYNNDCSVITDNMKKDCVFAWKTTEASKDRPRVVCAMDLKRTEKYGSLNGT